MKKQSKIDRWYSTPITNLAYDEKVINSIEFQSYVDNHLNNIKLLYNRCAGKCVETHKKIFGRQNYCWNGEFRYWVWEFEDKLRLFVSNHQGVSVEVNANLTFVEALPSVLNYYKKFI